MSVHFVTGTTSGIGRALVEKLLDQGEQVVSISRKPLGIEHDDLLHMILDLSDMHAVDKFHFPMPEGGEAVLYNNAGIIGEVKPLWEQDTTSISQTIQVNLTALMVLSQKFVQALIQHGASGTLINISSGAASSAIPSWTPYCTSKAGVDMFSRTLDAEIKERGIPCKVWSVAPGVVDTQMQSDIRSADEEDFSRRSHFVSLKEEGGLVDPGTTALHLTELARGQLDAKDVVLSLRDFY